MTGSSATPGRRSLLLGVASLTTVAGCSGDSPGPLIKTGTGEYEHPILFRNDATDPLSFTLTLTRDGETLVEEHYTVAPNTTRTLAGATRDADGGLTIRVEMDDGGVAIESVGLGDCSGWYTISYGENSTDPSINYPTC